MVAVQHNYQLAPSSASCDYAAAAWNFQETTDLHQISLLDMVVTDPYAPNFSLLQESFFQHPSEGYSCHNYREEGKKAKKNCSKKRISKNELSDLLTRETISQYFYMPITQAAKAMNVGLTFLKRRCREVGIRRWPRRKLMSLQRLINNLQDEYGKEEGEERTREALKVLEGEKKVVEEIPDMELKGETKRLRQAFFKSNYKKRRLMEINHENTTTPTQCSVSMLEDEEQVDYEEIMSFLTDP